ncbi:hypothetical protein [Rhodobacter aestuarii]|nr:hypothetical protein [Rhodobacter aestuarii]
MSTKDELYRELRDKRSASGAILFRMNAFFVVFIGLKISNSSLMTEDITLMSAIFILTMTTIVTFYLYHGYRAYKTIASVIVRINTELGLFDDSDSPSYAGILPLEWLKFGKAKPVEAGWLITPWIFALATITIIYI